MRIHLFFEKKKSKVLDSFENNIRKSKSIDYNKISIQFSKISNRRHSNDESSEHPS